MQERFGRLIIAALASGAVALLTAAVPAGQAPAPAAKAQTSRPVPRTAQGKPDLQGFYYTATITPLERPVEYGTRRNLTPAEVEALERDNLRRNQNRNQASAADRNAPPVGGNVGGYNNFWIDSERGTDVTEIDGQARTSLIIDPPDGRIPPLTPEARKRNTMRVGTAVRPTSDAPEQEAGQGAGAFDDIELRPLGERCLLGFGSTSGPPALPVLYNNHKQIVQTPEYIIILNEMVHDVRFIRMNQPHLPPHIQKWLGDSVGRWEGDTLVVDTTNFTDKTRFRGSTDKLHVVERFRRLDGDKMLYQFTVEDPTTWTKPWTAEYIWNRSDELMYEYSCHEGNYAMGDIMRGERLLDAERAKAAPR